MKSITNDKIAFIYFIGITLCSPFWPQLCFSIILFSRAFVWCGEKKLSILNMFFYIHFIPSTQLHQSTFIFVDLFMALRIHLLFSEEPSRTCAHSWRWECAANDRQLHPAKLHTLLHFHFINLIKPTVRWNRIFVGDKFHTIDDAWNCNVVQQTTAFRMMNFQSFLTFVLTHLRIFVTLICTIGLAVTYKCAVDAITVAACKLSVHAFSLSGCK